MPLMAMIISACIGKKMNKIERVIKQMLNLVDWLQQWNPFRWLLVLYIIGMGIAVYVQQDSGTVTVMAIEPTTFALWAFGGGGVLIMFRDVWWSLPLGVTPVIYYTSSTFVWMQRNWPDVSFMPIWSYLIITIMLPLLGLLWDHFDERA